MAELVNQRKKFFAEERAKARRSKPMTQSLLRNYMMNYLKNQGTWKLTQLKKLSFEEVKEEYDIWAMEMEHYLEYIDNDVWKVIQNGISKKRISTGKDDVVRVLPPVSAAEIHAVKKERKAITILLIAIPK
ncbi:hypothetical protein Tco_0399079, partial [Tanacetum coccineum]